MLSISAMLLPGENRSSRRKPCPSATLSTIYITWTGLGLQPRNKTHTVHTQNSRELFSVENP